MVAQLRGANNGVGVSQILAASISNADIHASAAIAGSKLAITVKTGTGTEVALNSQILATKDYAEALAQGFGPKRSVKYANAATLPSNTINGTGVGKTITLTGLTAWSPDGVAVVNGERVLIKNYGGTGNTETSNINNGIYVVSGVGTEVVLTRSTDFDQTPDGEIRRGDYTMAEAGTVNQGRRFGVVSADLDETTNSIDDEGVIEFTRIFEPTSSSNSYSTITGDSGSTTASGEESLAVLGTSNRVTTAVTADTVTIDIASTYVGQSSITTLGTITSGTWNGTTVTVPYGGTGATTFGANSILVGNGTSAVSGTSNATFVSTGPGTELTFSSTVNNTITTLAGLTSVRINLRTGAASSGTSGNVNLETGNGSVNSGNVNLQTGTAGITTGTIRFLPGTVLAATISSTGINLASGNTYQIDGNAIGLNELADVIITSSVKGNTLYHNGTEYVNSMIWSTTGNSPISYRVGTFVDGDSATVTDMAVGDIIIGVYVNGLRQLSSTFTAGAGEVTTTETNMFSSGDQIIVEFIRAS